VRVLAGHVQRRVALPGLIVMPVTFELMVTDLGHCSSCCHLKPGSQALTWCSELNRMRMTEIGVGNARRQITVRDCIGLRATRTAVDITC